MWSVATQQKKKSAMYRFHNKNSFLSPHDPAYDDSYDAEEAYDAYEAACEMREEMKRENG